MFATHADPLTGDDDVAVAEAALRREGGGLGAYATASAGATIMEALDTERPHRDPQNPATWGKVARNGLCPCGSGRKYKHCHGVLS